MAGRGSQNSLPWQYSEALGGHYLYIPSRDEIVRQDWTRFRRPPNLRREHLQSAIWEEPRNVELSRSYRPQAGPAAQPGQGRPRTVDSLSTNMAALSVSGGTSDAPGDPITVINRRTKVQSTVIFKPTSQRDDDLRARKIPAHQVLCGTDGEQEVLFAKYKRRDAAFFSKGRVFMVLWAEPAGETATDVTSMVPGSEIGSLGERVFSKVRRFVVIREGPGYCSALPVNTYGGRGVAKPRVTKSEHAIIYTGRFCPEPNPDELPRRGEGAMRPLSIRVDQDNREEKLDRMSRLDFGKVHTVEHNIKARSFGNVNREFMEPLLNQFQNVWQKDSGPRAPTEAERLARLLRNLVANGKSEEEARKLLLAMLQKQRESKGAAGREAADDEADDQEDEDDDEDEDEDEDDNGGRRGARPEDDAEEEDLYSSD